MPDEVQQYKESISDKYIKDFKKELKFSEKLMILPIENKMKEILKSNKKIDVSSLRDLEDLGFWRKVLGVRIGEKQLFESLMTKTFNFLKEKQEKIIEAESVGRLEELTSLVINGKLDELDNLVLADGGLANNNVGQNGGQINESLDSGNPNESNPNNPNPDTQGSLSHVDAPEGDGADSNTLNLEDNTIGEAIGATAGTVAAFEASMATAVRVSGRGGREAVAGVELSAESARDLMDRNIQLLESQLKSDVKMSKSMRVQISSSIKEFQSAKAGINGNTIDAVKIWESFGDKLPQSVINNLKIKPETAMQLEKLTNDEIELLIKKSNDATELRTLLKETKNIDVSEDVAKMLKVAKNTSEFRGITTIFKELKGVRQFLKCMKGACLASFIFLGFDIWAFIDTGREADMIKQYNKERGMYKQQWANAQLGIGIGGAVLDILILVGTYVGIGACCGPWGVVAGLAVAAIQIAVTFALESYYAKEEFYAQNRIDFSTKSRTYVKQSIVQLLESDRKNLNEGMKAEVRELRGPDSQADTLEDAREALIFQEECEVGWYIMIQQYYYSGKSEEDFLKELTEDQKKQYDEEKQELEGIIKVRMEYIKKYIKKDTNSPEYLSMKKKLESNQGISYVEQVLADSKVYATLHSEDDDSYIENYKDLDVEGYKQAYKTKLKSEYPENFELFENLSSERPAQLVEIFSGVSILKNYLLDISDGSVVSELGFSQEELSNIKKNIEFVEKYDKYFNLGRPIEKKMELVSMDSSVDFAYVEQLLADNFASLNKRRSWDKETTLNYMYGSSYRNRLEAKYDVSDSLTENILYSIAKEFHGYQGRNDTLDLINFYNEGDKNSLGIYYDTRRRFNLDWCNDAKITSDISSLDGMSPERILKIFNRGELDSDAEAADAAVNSEYQKRVREIIIRETNYRANKGEYEQQIVDFIKSNSVDGGYVELPYDSVIAAKKAGIGKIENYLFKVQDGNIYAISCGDTVDEVLHFDKINQKFIYEATTPLRDTLTEEENNLIKSVDIVCNKLSEIRSVEIDFWHDHTDELDIPVQLERVMSKKMQDWEKEKDMIYYMEPLLAKDYLKNKAKEYYDYFDGLYRGLLNTITSYKNGNDINDINEFNMSFRWISQFDILSINDKGEFEFHSSVPEAIAGALPQLFDYYKDKSTGKTVSELLRGTDADRKKGQFFARQIYTIFMEESVLYYKNGTLNDFHVDGERNFDIDKIKSVLNDKMEVYTFADAYQCIDSVKTNEIILKEKGIRQVTSAEKEFHSNIEAATQDIVSRTGITGQDLGYDVGTFLVGGPGVWETRNAVNRSFHRGEVVTSRMDLVDRGELRGDPTFLADVEQKNGGVITGGLRSWGNDERITVYLDESGEKIKSIKVDGFDMEFKNVEEGFRVANMINWIKKNKKDNPKGKSASNRLWGKYDDYFWNNGCLDRNITGTTINLNILSVSAVDQLYSSIKNNQSFIDYINSDKV